ncbi:MAG TPA: response regulator [Sphingomicrobium sp.]|nr:response regulator [Sphingomicrobium sp.]
MDSPATIYVLDDDADLALSVTRFLQRSGYDATAYSDAAVLLEDCKHKPPHCVISDVMMGEIDGFMVAEKLRRCAPTAAVIFITAWPKTSAAVDAIRNFGGIDYMEKPIQEQRLLDGVAEAVEWSSRRQAALARLECLTPREWDVFRLLARGMSNKMIAATLDIKPKTVEDHRAAIMAKTRSSCVAHLVELERALERSGS